jgi:hypothetical protein
MQVYRYNARTDELMKLTDEVINRIAFLCGDTAAQVKAELLDGVDGDELLRRCLNGAGGPALRKTHAEPRSGNTCHPVAIAGQ